MISLWKCRSESSKYRRREGDKITVRISEKVITSLKTIAHVDIYINIHIEFK